MPAMSGLHTGELLRVAERIEAHAHALRSRATTLSTASAHARWQSPAAAKARLHMQHGIDELGASANRLDHAAAALRAHARTVRRVDALLHGAQRVVGEAEHLTGSALHALRRLR